MIRIARLSPGQTAAGFFIVLVDYLSEGADGPFIEIALLSQMCEMRHESCGAVRFFAAATCFVGL